MNVVVHLARAGLVFWVAAILLPGAVLESRTLLEPGVRHERSAQTALADVSSTSGLGLEGVARAARDVQRAEDDVRRLVARVRLEVDRFIAQLP